MQVRPLKPQVTFLNFPPTPALENRIYNKIAKLNQFHNKIMHCDVVVEQEQRNRHQGKFYKVRIALTVPGEKINVNHPRNENIGIAIRDAFLAARRLLLNYSQRRRGDVKAHPLMQHGIITRLFSQKRYGFIKSNGQEYYFSETNVSYSSFDQLTVGSEVQFIGTLAGEGWQAHRVSLGKHHSTILDRAISTE